VGRLVDIVEAELLQEIADDPEHRLVVVDDEDGHSFIDGHRSSPITKRRDETATARPIDRVDRRRLRDTSDGYCRGGGRWLLSASMSVTCRARSGAMLARIGATLFSFMRSTTPSSTLISSLSKICAASLGFMASSIFTRLRSRASSCSLLRVSM